LSHIEAKASGFVSTNLPPQCREKQQITDANVDLNLGDAEQFYFGGRLTDFEATQIYSPPAVNTEGREDPGVMDDHLYEDNYAFETYANGVCIVSDAPGMRTGGTSTNPWFVQAEDKRLLTSQFRSVYAPVPSFPTDPLRPWDRPRPSMIRTSWRPLSSHVAHSTQGIVMSVGPPQNQPVYVLSNKNDVRATSAGRGPRVSSPSFVPYAWSTPWSGAVVRSEHWATTEHGGQFFHMPLHAEIPISVSSSTARYAGEHVPVHPAVTVCNVTAPSEKLCDKVTPKTEAAAEQENKGPRQCNSSSADDVSGAAPAVSSVSAASVKAPEDVPIPSDLSAMLRRFFKEEFEKNFGSQKAKVEKESNEQSTLSENVVPAKSPEEAAAVVVTAPSSVNGAVATSSEPLPKTVISGHSSEKGRQFLKLERFDGRTEIEAFLKRFDVCARRNKWDDEEKLDQLICSLSAPADQVLWDFESSTVRTCADLIQRLRSRYGSIDQATLFQAQLASRRQKEGEDLATLVQDIRRLMTLAFPGCTSEYGELLAIRAFLDSLKDRSLSLKIREREPKTLDQAFKLGL